MATFQTNTTTGVTYLTGIIENVATNAAQTSTAPTIDVTLTAGYSSIVNRQYTIALGKKLTIPLGARFRIL